MTQEERTLMKRIGIIGAMDAEVSLLKASITDQKTEVIAQMEFVSGKMGGTEAVVVKCGMGKVNAGICAHTLINRYGVSEVINTGVGGSLDNRIDIGDIVVSTDAVQHDFDVRVIGFQRGEIPYTGLYAFPADPSLIEAAIKAVRDTAPEVKVFEGRVCSVDQFIASSEQKKAIIDNFGGLCCEMEGAAIAQTCYLNQTPYVIIRAISDKADDSAAMDYPTFEKKAVEHSVKLIEGLMEAL